MRLVYINPNSTRAMTDNVVAAARAALPEAEIIGMTNVGGPSAIQGAQDGEAAVPGLLRLLPVAQESGADAIVIACFDDTGLTPAQAVAGCPVLGLGQASYLMASLLGRRFSVVTSLPISIPVIEANIRGQGFAAGCASVRASGLSVLTIDAGSDATCATLAAEIRAARDADGAAAVVLGCAGMAALKTGLAARTGVPLIDGVEASALLAGAAVRLASGSR